MRSRCSGRCCGALGPSSSLPRAAAPVFVIEKDAPVLNRRGGLKDVIGCHVNRGMMRYGNVSPPVPGGDRAALATARRPAFSSTNRPQACPMRATSSRT